MSMKRNVIRVAMVVVGIGSMGWAATTTEPVKFAFKPEVGKVSRMRMVVKSVGSVKMPDPIAEQKFAQTFGQDYQTVCRKINADGSAVYDVTMPRIDMKMDTSGFTVDVEVEKGKVAKFSQSPNAPVADKKMDGFGRIFTAMTDIQFTLILGADGKPIRIEGFAESVKKALGKMEGLGFAEKTMLDAMKGSMLNDETMISNMRENSHLIPPGGSARVGDTWSRTTELKMPMFQRTLKTEATYTLLGVETIYGRQCAKIAIRETIGSVPVAKSAPTSTAPASSNIFESMEYSLKSNDGQGIAYVDYTNGELVQLRKTARMVMAMTMKNFPGVSPSPSPQSGNAAQFHMEHKLNTSVNMDLVGPDGKPVAQP